MRSRDETLDRLQKRSREADHWQKVYNKIGSLDALTNMHYARERAKELTWMLEGTTPDEKILIIGGPFSGSKVDLVRQPPRIEIQGSLYVRIDDPDTGESLGAYALE